jgi:hypothetical protein
MPTTLSRRAVIHSEMLEARQLLSGALPASAADDATPGTLAPTVFVTLPPTAIAGAKVKGASALVTVTNVAPDDYNGPVTITLFASMDATLDAGADPQIISVTKKLKVASADTANVKIKIPSLPDAPDGSYVVIAQLSSPTAGVGVNATDESVVLSGPFVDLSGTFAPLPASAAKGKRLKASIAVANSGNVTAKGTIPVTIATSPNVDGSSPTTLATLNARVSVKPGASKNVKVNFVVPTDLASGSYYVVATLDPTNVLGETSVTNNTVLSTTALNVA